MKSFKTLFALLLALVMVCSMQLTAFAAPVDEATIDTLRTGSVDIYKYDFSSAAKDGIWDNSYVSTGVRDEAGVEAVLGSSDRVSALNSGGEAFGYAIKGVVFSYVKVGDIRTYTESENGAEHVEVLYGIAPTAENNAFLSAIGVSTEDRYVPADDDSMDVMTYYYQSDVLINGLKNALETNSTAVKAALEAYMQNVGGSEMPETDANGHSSVSGLPLGLYLFVETQVPEMVTDTTTPFLVSVPTTSVNGNNATDGGSRWIYSLTLYPKNDTGVPSLEKLLRESQSDTGKNNGSTDDINDGFSHTGTASAGDVIDYEILSTLPGITSPASYLTDYSFIDSLSKGLTYTKGDLLLEFFKDEQCTEKIASWSEDSGKFTVSYNDAEDGGETMSIAMTSSGLSEINTIKSVYTDAGMTDSGYSRCTLRITYTAKVNSDDSVNYGEAGNDNEVVLTWKRTNSEYYDTLNDDCHVYLFALDVTKRFSDGKGNMSQVELLLYNETDKYYVTARLDQEQHVYYVTGHTDKEADATHFIPQEDGKLIIKGLEDDNYSMTEVKTANGYTLLKHSIKVVLTQMEDSDLCNVYTRDSLGVIQNDPRYSSVEPGRFHNLPQKQLQHKLLTASATVDGNKVNMKADGDSENAYIPFTIVNTRGFDLPQTGSRGNWVFPVVGLTGLALASLGIYFLMRKKATQK